MGKDELVHEIGEKIAANVSDDVPDWAHVVMAGRVKGNDSQMNGFAYKANGEYVPVSPTDFDILDLLVELRDEIAADDKRPPWQACLLQIERKTGEMNCEFEYDNSSRWAITPKNVDERAKEFNPVRG